MTQWISALRLAVLLGEAPLGSPLFVSLADRIRLLTIDGRLSPDVRLPSERKLAEALRLSRSTVAAAYGLLRDTGVLTARQGAGHFVRLSAAPASQMPGSSGESEDSIAMTVSAAAAAPGVMEAYRAGVEVLPGMLGGHGYLPAGLPILRDRLASWYSERGLPTTPDQLIITSGALAALNLIAGSVLGPGDRVLIDAPSYSNAIEAFRRRGARLMANPLLADPGVGNAGVGSSGWDVDGLAAALRQAAPRLAYLIPDFHNPNGRLMGTEARQQIAGRLSLHRCIPVVDETLVEISLDGAPPPLPFGAFQAETLTIGSASKAFWGGLRIGWIRAPRDQVRSLVEARATVDLGAPPLEQLVLSELLERAEQILPSHRETLAGRRDILLGLLADRLPDWRIERPAGGQTLWAELPQPWSSRLAALSPSHGLLLTPGHRFFPSGGGERHLRLPFTAEPAVLAEAVRRLVAAWDQVANTTEGARTESYGLIA